MGLRETINNNSAVATTVTVALFVVALGIFVWQLGLGGGGGALTGDNDAWYYDVESNTFFRAAYEYKTPITSPDGNDAVLAHVFSCDDSCGDISGKTPEEVKEQGMHVVRLERMTPEGHQRYDEVAKDHDANTVAMMMGEEMHELTEVRKIDEKQWYSGDSPRATRLYSEFSASCKSGRPKPCRPE